MNTKYEIPHFAQDKLVYVRPVDTADLPDDVQETVGDLTQVYAVHNAKGERLALVAERHMAYALAREHDLDAVTVH